MKKCGHDWADRHWCRGEFICPDCCHAKAKERADEEHRLGFSAGYAAAVDDLDLHDKFQCQRPIVQSLIIAPTSEAVGS